MEYGMEYGHSTILVAPANRTARTTLLRARVSISAINNTLTTP
jgi:hypothetical protein